MFPGLVVAMVVANQFWTFSGFLVGQMISWVVDVVGLIIVLRFFRGRVWPLVLAGGIVLTRLSGSGFQGEAIIDLVYLVLFNGLFCVVGMILALRYAPLVRRQIRWICLLSTIFMAMQTLGVGEWTQFLATENEGLPKTPEPTLFVEKNRLLYQTIQARPSGLLHSNNILSMFVLFALALEFSDERRKRLNRWDLTLAAMAVLSMAKIVALGTAMMMVWLLLFGTRPQRGRMLQGAALFVALMGLYRFLFPGLFELSTDSSGVTYSIYIRFNEFVDRLAPDNPLAAMLTPYLLDTARLVREENPDPIFSGYSQTFWVLPYLLAGAAVVLPLFMRGLKKLRQIDSSLGSASILVGCVAVVYPAAVPIFAAPVYWFMVGFAILPLLVLFTSERLRRAGIVPGVSDRSLVPHRRRAAAPAGAHVRPS